MQSINHGVLTMDLKQLEYIIAIDDEKSISKAAGKLFVTQSALNQQLLKIEHELGTKLFYRRHPFMVPTLAGTIYLNTARRIIEMKADTYKIIRDIANEDAGEISLTYTPEKGATMFSYIYPYFHQKYPNITFKIVEARVKKMEQLLLKKEVNIALTTYSEVLGLNKEFETVKLDSEQIILGIPSSNPNLATYISDNNDNSEYYTIDLTKVKYEKFVLMSKETLIRDIVDYCFEKAGFTPKVLFASSSSHTVVNMIRQQICLGFIPESYVHEAENICFFSLSPKQYWIRCIAYLKGTYLTKTEKYLIELFKLYHQGNLLPDKQF